MLIDWLKHWANETPSAIAFQDADSADHYRYNELYDLSCALASHLSSGFGIERGDRVAVLSTNELEYVALFFACQRLGAMLVPVNYRLARTEIEFVLADASPKILIGQDGVWSMDAVREFARKRVAEFRLGRAHADFPFAGGLDDACMILYTSGTTGLPKGTLVTNRMLVWNARNTSERLSLGPSDVALGTLPFFHTSGWNVLLTPFVQQGARTVLLRKFDADRVLELTSKERVTVMFGIPTTMEMMARSPLFSSVDLSSARYAIVGGEPMSLELIRTWQAKGVAIRQGYGLTEFGPSAFSLNEEDAIRKMGSIGFPNPYVEARIVDENSRDVAPGSVGELILRGEVCTPGYWRNPEATSQAIRDGWFYTGDLVRQDADGYYFVVGRKKEMFISGGENIYPVEIERVLSAHPSVREVAVVGVTDEKWGEVGKAFVVLKDGATLSADEVREFCLLSLARYKVPKHIEFRAELPKSTSGKILKRALTSPES